MTTLEQSIQDLYDKAMQNWTPEKQREQLRSGIERRLSTEVRSAAMRGEPLSEAYRPFLTVTSGRR